LGGGKNVPLLGKEERKEDRKRPLEGKRFEKQESRWGKGKGV